MATHFYIRDCERGVNCVEEKKLKKHEFFFLFFFFFFFFIIFLPLKLDKHTPPSFL